MDGSVFGTAIPHMFFKHFPTAAVKPPKPEIFGFPIF
jgi:hypothetical protein